MKVLLLNDWSSFHLYLKEGLQALGVDVYLKSWGDGWKQIGGDDFGTKPFSSNKLILTKQRFIEPLLPSNRFKDFDVVQWMNPMIFHTVMNLIMLRQMKDNNRCTVLVAAGGSYALRRAYKKGLFDYSVFDLTGVDYRKKMRAEIEEWVEKRVEIDMDLIIPMLYEYSLEHYGNVNPVIPAAINTDRIKYYDNKVNGRIVFMHGINRELEKGTPYIREALLRLKQKYPKDVEVVMDGHLPFNEYMDLMHRANVVVDQCLEYGYGMNAGIAMAQGKIVMAGARPEVLHAIGVDSSPVVHVQPDVKQIFSQMEWIVQNRNHITEMGEKSRLFVEEHHDYKKVAQRYIDAWKSTGKI